MRGEKEPWCHDVINMGEVVGAYVYKSASAWVEHAMNKMEEKQKPAGITFLWGNICLF